METLYILVRNLYPQPISITSLQSWRRAWSISGKINETTSLNCCASINQWHQVNSTFFKGFITKTTWQNNTLLCWNPQNKTKVIVALCPTKSILWGRNEFWVPFENRLPVNTDGSAAASDSHLLCVSSSPHWRMPGRWQPTLSSSWPLRQRRRGQPRHGRCSPSEGSAVNSWFLSLWQDRCSLTC